MSIKNHIQRMQTTGSLETLERPGATNGMNNSQFINNPLN